jgi:hypothetical protein
MTKWIILFAVLLSGSILGFMYVQINRTPTGDSTDAAVQDLNAVRVVDGYKDGFHRLSGTIRLPHSCYSLKTDASVRFDALDDVTITIITKDNILGQAVCANIVTRYPFQTIVEAPKVITLHLIVDGVEVPTIVEHVDWQNPSGNVVNSGS